MKRLLALGVIVAIGAIIMTMLVIIDGHEKKDRDFHGWQVWMFDCAVEEAMNEVKAIEAIEAVIDNPDILLVLKERKLEWQVFIAEAYQGVSQYFGWAKKEAMKQAR